MAALTQEKTYTIQAGDKPVEFYITVYFREGVAVTTFMPTGWTPKNLDMHTSLDFAHAVAQRYNLDEETIHEAIIDVLVEDEEATDLEADLRQSLRDLREGHTIPSEELWRYIYDDENEAD